MDGYNQCSGTLPVNPSPATTGLTGASAWNSANGMGQIYSNSDEINLRGFIRSSGWGNGGGAGVLSLILSHVSSDVSANIGFRVTASSGL